MISLLVRLLLKPNEKSEAELRKSYGVLCGAVGIALNILLFIGKYAAGILSGSIALLPTRSTISPTQAAPL